MARDAAIVATARLTLRLLTAADRDAVVALNADTRVMWHVGPPLSADDSAKMLRNALAGDDVVLDQPARMYAIDREQYDARRSHNG